MRAVFIAGLFAAFATQAPAQGVPHFATVPVAKSDLAKGDLSNALRHRIAGAIERVCGSYGDVVNGQFAEISKCRRAAWADVDRQIAKLGTEVRIAARAR